MTLERVVKGWFRDLSFCYSVRVEVFFALFLEDWREATVKKDR
jgi:hypothetical protein